MTLIAAGHAGEPLLHWDFERGSEDATLVDFLARTPLATLVPGAGRGGGAGLRVRYVGSEQGSERVLARIALPGAYRAATLNYVVRFAPDFQFVKSGKLHGLGPDKPIAGGREMQPDGWSARITWGGDSPKIYVYRQDKSSDYGVGPKAEDFHFARERWYDLALYVQVNEPATEANGVVELYADGKLLVSDSGIRFRAVDGPETLIRNFLFNTFHGGHAPENAPRDTDGKLITVHAFFDDFAVFEGKHIRGKP